MSVRPLPDGRRFVEAEDGRVYVAEQDTPIPSCAVIVKRRRHWQLACALGLPSEGKLYVAVTRRCLTYVGAIELAKRWLDAVRRWVP